MPYLTVNHLAGSAFLADMRGHTLVVDEPDRKSAERGPTAIETFLSGVAACAAASVVATCAHRLPYDGVRVECEWWMRVGVPPRIDAIRMRVLLPQDPDRETYVGIIDAFHRCPVRAAVQRSVPAVAIELRSFAEWASMTAADSIERAPSAV